MKFNFYTSLASILFAFLMISVVLIYDINRFSNASVKSERIEIAAPARSINNADKLKDYHCPYLRKSIEKGCPAFAPTKPDTDLSLQIKKHML